MVVAHKLVSRALLRATVREGCGCVKGAAAGDEQTCPCVRLPSRLSDAVRGCYVGGGARCRERRRWLRDRHPASRSGSTCSAPAGRRPRRHEGAARRQGRQPGRDGEPRPAGPPGFTITTEVCAAYYATAQAARRPEAAGRGGARTRRRRRSARTFGDDERPLLVSVRSGARASMPGMMDTILNLGLNDETVEGAGATLAATRASPTTATAASSRCMPTSCSASITACSRTCSTTSRTSTG